jgi:hypothetical protein
LQNGNHEEALRELTTACRLHPDTLTKQNIEKAKNQLSRKIAGQNALQY